MTIFLFQIAEINDNIDGTEDYHLTEQFDDASSTIGSMQDSKNEKDFDNEIKRGKIKESLDETDMSGGQMGAKDTLHSEFPKIQWYLCDGIITYIMVFHGVCS